MLKFNDKGIEGPWELENKVNEESIRTRIIRITERCNNNCVFCPIPHEWKTGQTNKPLKDIAQAIDSCKKGTTIELGGAEPTLHPDFFKIVEYATSKGFKITLTTNARIFYYDKYAKQIAKGENVSVKTSLHSYSPEIQDSIAQVKGSFSQAVAGMKNLVDNDVFVHVNIVVNSKNSDELEELVNLLKFIGVGNICFSCMMLAGDEKNQKELYVSMEKVREKLPKAVALAESKGFKPVIEKFPMCIAPGKEHSFLKEPIFQNAYAKLKECAGCNFCEECIGIDKAYIDKGFTIKVWPIKKTNK